MKNNTSKVSREAVPFLPDAIEIKNEKLPLWARYSVIFSLIFFLGAILWASLGKVDVVVKANGKITSDKQNIVMKPRESSIVKKIHVRVGDIVEKDDLLITFDPTINGAEVYDREAEKSIIREEIPVATAVEIMKILDRYDVIYDCYRADWGWMTKSLQEKSEPYATDEHYLKMIREFRHPVAELKEHLLSTPEDGDVQKIMLFAQRGDRPKALEILGKIADEVRSSFPEIKATASTWNDLEFNIASAHKGNSLKRFAEHLGCTIDECAAFGDGMNDLTMIQSAGYGVAMGNAVAEVINAAKIRTLTNDEDGVAAVLESWF